jgi:hypothetical protein
MGEAGTDSGDRRVEFAGGVNDDRGRSSLHHRLELLGELEPSGELTDEDVTTFIELRAGHCHREAARSDPGGLGVGVPSAEAVLDDVDIQRQIKGRLLGEPVRDR